MRGNNWHFKNKELAKMLSRRFNVQANVNVVQNIKSKVKRCQNCG